MYMTANTVPVYRHGRKFYVSAEEFERMRAEQRQHRRTNMQKSQNLPVSKSHQTNFRTPSTFIYNPIQRSTSQPHDHRYGVLRTPHLPTNSMINNNTRHESTRQSRSTFRYYDGRDDVSLVATALPMKVSPTAIRSNSSDKVLDLRRTPPPSISSYGGYIPEDYELKRSFSERNSTTTTSPTSSNNNSYNFWFWYIISIIISYHTYGSNIYSIKCFKINKLF